MQLNTNKSKYAIFGSRSMKLPNTTPAVTINNQSITRIGNSCQEKSIKFLGVHLDETLTWNTHVDYICKKVSQSLFAIYRVKNVLPKTALKSLYYTLIHSHLTYAIQIWGHFNNLNKLITKQKRAIRAYLSHTEPLFKQYHILKLQDLYTLESTLCMYKLQNNLLHTSFKVMK